MKETRALPTDVHDWKRMRFKGNKVWVAVDREGQLVQQNGKVLIQYQLGQDYEYWVYPRSVLPLDATPDEAPNAPRDKSGPQPTPTRVTRTDVDDRKRNVSASADAVTIFTDGASSGNPGPAGIGILLRFGNHEKEISEYIGIATNNIAELTAIKTGLMAVKRRGTPVRIYTDSTYALGVLTKGWKAKKNQDLINTTKSILSKFKDVKLLKVKGHAGNEGNERADGLATAAISAAPNRHKP